jgi:hypothetical protein
MVDLEKSGNDNDTKLVFFALPPHSVPWQKQHANLAAIILN